MSVVVLSPPTPPLYFVFENSNLLRYIQKLKGTRARSPVMGTIIVALLASE